MNCIWVKFIGDFIAGFGKPATKNVWVAQSSFRVLQTHKYPTFAQLLSFLE
jgi:hypothetical protein